MEYEKQVAIVTGGAGGIGAAVTRRLVGGGASVVAVDRDEGALERLKEEAAGWGEDASQRVHTYDCDITDSALVDACVADTVERHGRLDILVNNAGITGKNTNLWETPDDWWHRIYAVHTHGTFYFMRAAIPHMLERDYGRIANVASIAGKEGNARSSSYSGAKAAVIGMTKSVAKELAHTNVRVNSITPTVITTPMNKQVSKDYHEALLAKIPMGRPGRPEEVADMIGFMVSEACSFTSGAVFDISGGRATY